MNGDEKRDPGAGGNGGNGWDGSNGSSISVTVHPNASNIIPLVRITNAGGQAGSGGQDGIGGDGGKPFSEKHVSVPGDDGANRKAGEAGTGGMEVKIVVEDF